MKSDMNNRLTVTYILIFTGFIMVLLPLSGNRSFEGKPELLLSRIMSENTWLSADQVARSIANEDSTIQLIDVRDIERFKAETLPGAVSVPYGVLASGDPDLYLNNKNVKSIFFADDDFLAALALTYARGLGYNDCYALSGGLKVWKETVVNTKFTGERLTARENALFEARTKASRLFVEFNMLPDSMKVKYLESKRFDPKKLDGGCE